MIKPRYYIEEKDRSKNKTKFLDYYFEKLVKESSEYDVYLSENNTPIIEEKKAIKILQPISIDSFISEFKKAYFNVNKKEFSETVYGVENSVNKKDLEPIILVKTLFYYITNNELFYKSPLMSGFTEPNLKKGILIAGLKGCGKTSIIKSFHELIYNSEKYNILDIKEQPILLDWYKIQRFTYNTSYNLIEQIKQGEIEHLSKVPMYIDDLMRESEKKDYGNEINLKELLIRRYDNGSRTLCSMNYIEELTPQDLFNSFCAKYGSPLDDRFFEMFNIIELKSDKSFRR